MIRSYAGCECADICFEAAKICLERDISFALTFLPGSSKPLFAASESLPQRVSSLSDCKDGFILNTFASEIKSPFVN